MSNIDFNIWNIPSNWTWGKIIDIGDSDKNAIVDGPFGSNLKVCDYIEDGEIPVLTTANLSGDYSPESLRYISKEKFETIRRSAVKSNDIIMAKIGSCGKCGFYPEQMPTGIIPANLLKITTAKNVNRRFVFYFLNCPEFKRNLDKIIKATAQPAFNITTFKIIPFPIVPLNEQNIIVAEIEKQFSRLDAGVAALERVRDNLKRYRDAVLKSACEGRLVSQTPTDEPASELLKRILKERRARWEAAQLAAMKAKGTKPKNDKWKSKYTEPAPPDTSNLPELPKGWTWATVEQLSYMVQYGTSEKSSADSSGIPVLRMGNIQNGELDFTNLKYMTKDSDELKSMMLASGDILFNRTNSAELVGKTAVFKSHHPKSVFASYLIRVKVFIKHVAPDYISCVINSSYGRSYIKSVVSQQVGQANVNGTKLSAIPIPLPPFQEQKRIVEEIETIFSTSKETQVIIEKNLLRSDRLRQSILKQAFSGKLVPQTPGELSAFNAK